MEKSTKKPVRTIIQNENEKLYSKIENLFSSITLENQNFKNELQEKNEIILTLDLSKISLEEELNKLKIVNQDLQTEVENNRKANKELNNFTHLFFENPFNSLQDSISLEKKEDSIQKIESEFYDIVGKYKQLQNENDILKSEFIELKEKHYRDIQLIHSQSINGSTMRSQFKKEYETRKVLIDSYYCFENIIESEKIDTPISKEEELNLLVTSLQDQLTLTKEIISLFEVHEIALKDEKSALLESVEKLTEENSESNIQIKELSNQIEELEDQNLLLKEILKNCRSKNEESEKIFTEKISFYQSAIDTIENSHQKNMKKIKDLENTFKEMNENIQNYQKQVSMDNDKIEELEKNILELTTNNEDYINTIKKLREDHRNDHIKWSNSIMGHISINQKLDVENQKLLAYIKEINNELKNI